MMARNSLLKLVSILFILIFVIKVEATVCSTTRLNLNDLTNIVENSNWPCDGTVEGTIPIRTGEFKGELLDDGSCAYGDGLETGAGDITIDFETPGGGNDMVINAGDNIILSYDATAKTIYFPSFTVPGSGASARFYPSDDGSTFWDSSMTNLTYGANNCGFCDPPKSGDWIISDGLDCTLNHPETITGNLNISDGGLQIQSSGALTVSGGYVYIYPLSNFTMLSGGQING